MSKGTLFVIRFPEDTRAQGFWSVGYPPFLRLLQAHGVPGATAFRDTQGFDIHGRLQNSHTDYTTSLPVTVEVYVSSKDVKEVRQHIYACLPPSSQVIVIENVLDVKSMDLQRFEGLEGIDVGQASVLRIYMHEDDQYHHKPLYYAFIQEFKKQGVLWVDVQRAFGGFGTSRVSRKRHAFPFSGRAPVVLEVVVESSFVPELMACVGPLIHSASGPAVLMDAQLLNPRSLLSHHS